jgi:hypothetical protein
MAIGAVAGAGLAGADARAQDAVQWRVEDGGNGHWYGLVQEPSAWPELQAACRAIGGHLVTLTTPAEWLWVKTSLPVAECFVGGYQDHAPPLYTEPNGGWRWVTDEAFELDLSYMGSEMIGGNMTKPGFDDCPGGTVGSCGCGPGGAQDVLLFPGCCDNRIDDVGDGVVDNCDSVVRRGVIEWSADCNADGIVDFGQIRAGELEDANGNNIPDCCEQGSPCSLAALEWSVSAGGNGHWYAGVVLDPTASDWSSARAGALAAGGDLASLNSTAEANWVFEMVASNPVLWRISFGPWLGGFQKRGGNEPAEGWIWVDGTAVDPVFWAPDEPANFTACGAAEDFINYFNDGLEGPQNWINDLPESGTCSCCSNPPENRVASAIIEWSADCNADGIVDFGQIRAGELEDANGNNIPDCCENGVQCDPCPGDADASGTVDGVDLAIILSRWGTPAKDYPAADTNGDGTVDGIDLATVLGGWGACP